MSDNLIIEINDLHKAYGDFSVLRGVSLQVGAGEVYGLLGPNGSGKTTLIHVLLGLLRPDQGRVRIFGTTPERATGRMGYLPERLRYHLRFTAREFLRFMGQFDDMPAAMLNARVEQLLHLVELQEAADRMMSTYSKGMLQRLGVAQALLSDPDLLLIDEPTSGLDPAGQREIFDILAEVRSRGHTIFLCTHYLSEVELLCDRVGVLSNGQIGAEADVHDLRTIGASVVIRLTALDDELRARLSTIDRAVECQENRVLIRPNSPTLQAKVLRTLIEAEALIIALEPLESPLEELFARTVAPPALHIGAETALPQIGGLTLPASLLPMAGPASPAEDETAPEGATPESDSGETRKDRPAGEGDTLLRDLLKRNKDSAVE